VDSLFISEYGSELYTEVHSSAPGLVSSLVSVSMFEVLPVITMWVVISTLKG
jgi:hypothetical protein